MKYLSCMFFGLFLIYPTLLKAANNNLLNRDGQIYELKSGNVVMKISSYGGRIISFKKKNKEILTSESEHDNYGSTLWPSPQFNWNWPPPTVLDSEEYSVEKNNNTLTMTSKVDLKNGIQVKKSWVIGEKNSILVSYLIKNITQKAKSVAAWEVTRVSSEGIIFFLEGEEVKLPISSLTNVIKVDGVNWLKAGQTPSLKHTKLLASAKGGWLAHAHNGLLFIKQFPDVLPKDFPPKHGEVEIYFDKDRKYVELENHSQYKKLTPGDSIQYQVKWSLHAVNSKLVANHPSNKLLLKTLKKLN